MKLAYDRLQTLQDRLKTAQNRRKTASRSNFASIFVLRWPKMTSSSLPEPILAQLGPILGPFWPQLGPLGTPRTLQKCRFSLGFCTFSAFHRFRFIFSSLGPRDAVLARSWAILGPSWALLGPILGPSWALVGLLGASWGSPGAFLGVSFGLSGPSWGHPAHNVSQPYLLAPLFDRSWAFWGRFGALLGPSWDPSGSLWGLSRASRGAPGPLLELCT